MVPLYGDHFSKPEAKPMQSILVQVSGTSAQDARVEAALSIARAFGGHVTFCHPTPPEIVVGGLEAAAVWTMASFEDVAAKTKEFREKTKAQITEKMISEDVQWDWPEIHGFPHEAFVAQSALADIAIVTLLEDDFSFETQERFLGHVVTRAACPVLALPADQVTFNPFGKVLIAWDGSFEAAKAVKLSLSLLQKAEDILLVSVGNIHDRFMNLTDLATYLARHDIHATTDVVPKKGHVSDQLLETAKAIDASYIVMGGYGRPRIVEMVLGGETRRMLKQTNIPVLFAH